MNAIKIFQSIIIIKREKRERERIVLHEKRKSCLLTVPLK